MATILLTGATGQLGAALLPRLLGRGGARLVALVRRPSSASGADAEVVGDIERPLLGLDPAAHEALASDLVEVYHCAAATRFDLALDEARRANVAGTRNVLALAALAPLFRRFHHVSTAYVGGAHNSYEVSKAEGEEAVRASGLAFTIHRPSVIVGEARTGRTRSYNVLYYPMRLGWRGRLPALPHRPGAAIDVVPVDWVADAILSLAARADTAGRTCGVVSGEPIAIPALAGMLSDALDRARARRGRPPIRRPALIEATDDVAKGLEQYLPYLVERRPRFEPEGGLEPAPPLASYVDRIVEYAVEHEFGARPRLEACRG